MEDEIGGDTRFLSAFDRLFYFVIFKKGKLQ